jgi:hypothetical protein
LRLDLHLRLHKHEHRVLSDFEILCESLLEVVFGGFDVPALAIDQSGEDVSLDEGRVFLEAVVKLS